MSASMDGPWSSSKEVFSNKPAEKKVSPKKLNPIVCNLGSHLEFPEGCKVEIHGSELPEDAPFAFYIGNGLCVDGVRTLQLTFGSSCSGRDSLLQAARRAMAEVFKRARDNHARGVYIIGHGIGALFAAKLLADKQFLDDCPSSYLLQAVFLIAGIYDMNEDAISNLIKTEDSCDNAKLSSAPQNINRKPSLVNDIVSNHQSFEDRARLSFICDLSNRYANFDDSEYQNDSKKGRSIGGIHHTPVEVLQFSPVFQNTIGFTQEIEINNVVNDRNDKGEDDDLSASFEEVEIAKKISGGSREFSPLFEDYHHLKRFGMRVYVFAAEKDGVCISKQSRDMYDCLAQGCDQEDMHFQVKEKVDRKDMRELLKQDDNFLKRLMRYDTVKYL